MSPSKAKLLQALRYVQRGFTVNQARRLTKHRSFFFANPSKESLASLNHCLSTCTVVNNTGHTVYAAYIPFYVTPDYEPCKEAAPAGATA